MDTLTFDRDGCADLETMSPETILVSPLSLVQTTVTTARVSHLVTLINGETLIDTPVSIGQDRHLRLAMNDISEPRDGLVVPTEDHVAKLIEFATAWDQQARSSFIAGPGSAARPQAPLSRFAPSIRVPTSIPWRRALRQRLAHRLPQPADRRLGRQRARTWRPHDAAVDHIGRGVLAEEGKVFSLPARHAA